MAIRAPISGITVPNFPNLFMMYGPNTNIVVNGSIIFFSECEMRYIMGCLDLLLEKGHAAMEVKKGVHDAFNEQVDAANEEMAWGAPQVSSWYKNEKGRVTPELAVPAGRLLGSHPRPQPGRLPVPGQCRGPRGGVGIGPAASVLQPQAPAKAHFPFAR